MVYSWLNMFYYLKKNINIFYIEYVKIYKKLNLGRF